MKTQVRPASHLSRPSTTSTRILCLLLAWAFTGACSDGGEVQKPRSVLLITLDTTRADALGSYGRTPSVTPHMDELARQSVRFNAAHTVAPLTLPAHASMLTGLTPPRHTLRDNGLWPLPAEAQTVAELAAQRGLATGAFVSSSVLDRSFGLDAGFATYEQPVRANRPDSSHFSERSASDTTRAATKWLRSRARDESFFAWVHLFDPHVPYAPPESFQNSAGGDPYLGEVAFVDQAVGELLATLADLGQLDTTLVVLVADHGEALGEHGEPTHGVFCYQATLRVPLLIRDPSGLGAGTVVHEPVSVADLAPTIIEALELGRPDGLDGLSLFRRKPPADRGVYFECYAGYLDYGWSPLAGWLDATGKFIASSSPELYDLRSDAREASNLLPARNEERVRFERALAELASRPSLQRDRNVARDAALVRELGALGYADAGDVQGVLPNALERPELPSPAERASELQSFLRANSLIEERAYSDAAALLEEILRDNPRNPLALDQLAFALMQLERFDDARAALERRVALPFRRAATHFNLATVLERQGEIASAVLHLRAALEIDATYLAAQEALDRLELK